MYFLEENIIHKDNILSLETKWLTSTNSTLAVSQRTMSVQKPFFSWIKGHILGGLSLGLLSFLKSTFNWKQRADAKRKRKVNKYTVDTQTSLSEG